jgi:hypothetical protein
VEGWQIDSGCMRILVTVTALCFKLEGRMRGAIVHNSIVRLRVCAVYIIIASQIPDHTIVRDGMEWYRIRILQHYMGKFFFESVQEQKKPGELHLYFTSG